MYPIQKALHLSDAKKKKSFILREVAVLEKLDGWYVYIDIINGKWGKLCSSSGREIPSLEYLQPLIAKTFTTAVSTRFIFEATIPNLPFHETNGILNRKYESAENVVLNLHDMVELDRPDIDFNTRYLRCKAVIDRFEQTLQSQVSIVPIMEVTSDETQIFDLFDQVISRNGEGVILKDIAAGYHFGKRNATMLKIKEEVTKDLAVVGMVEGEGKYEGTLGALIVQGRNGIKLQVSGMTDLQRESWWFNPSSIKGKVVEVKAMKELPDGTLREPRFKCVREDKLLHEID